MRRIHGGRVVRAAVRVAVLAAVLAGVILASQAGSAGALEPAPRVWPPFYPFNGKTYGQLGADWWKWAVEAPVPVNPLVDPTGANCAVNQPATRLWFLAGTTGGTAVRSCTVRYDRYVFFPLVTSAWFASEPGDTEALMHAQAKADIDGVNPATLFATVDGVAIPNLGSYRAHSPTFSVNLPPDNIFDAPPGTYGPSATDGYWLLLFPLRPGQHTVRFGGTLYDGTPVEAIYHLNVVY